MIMVYAIPCGGQREFNFPDGEALYAHVKMNRPALLGVLPKEGDEKFEEKMDELRNRPFSMPQQN